MKQTVLAGALVLGWSFLLGCIFAGTLIIVRTRDVVDGVIAIVATPILMIGFSIYFWKWAGRFDHHFQQRG